MKLIDVSSTDIEAICFETKRATCSYNDVGTLYVRFVKSGKLACYLNVPRSVYLAILTAESVGATFIKLVTSRNYEWSYISE